MRGGRHRRRSSPQPEWLQERRRAPVSADACNAADAAPTSSNGPDHARPPPSWPRAADAAARREVAIWQASDCNQLSRL
jgi:hypothetical protein